MVAVDSVAASAALALAAHRLSDPATADAAAKAYKELEAAPWKLDAVDHWSEALQRVAAARSQLSEAQRDIRLVAAEGGADGLSESAAARNEARRALVDTLENALKLDKTRHAQQQWECKKEEELSLLSLAQLSLTQKLRLEWLQSGLKTDAVQKDPTEKLPPILPTLHSWMEEVGAMRAELGELAPHAGGEVPSLEALRGCRAAWEDAADALLDAQNAKQKRRPPPDAEERARAARRAVQLAERELRQERVRLAAMAAAHFPELLVQDQSLPSTERLLTLGADADADALGSLLVERELEHYDREETTLSAVGAPHKVWKASYDGEECVLKEYELGADPDRLRELLREVKLLGQLAQCPYIADVQAIFLQPQPHAAYVQLPYYNGGDLLAWLVATAPEPWRRKALLGQLCEALRHVHSHGVAHGDVKLENVLLSVQGEHATAHLADFESARRQCTATASLSTSTGGGSAFTELYVAPEILAAVNEGRAAKPTAAGDMFSYGVCCLFACCLPLSVQERAEDVRRFVTDGRQLAGWSRDKAGQADPHLPGLLDSLLAGATSNEQALALRLSASQALLHPFHSTAAAMEASAQREEQAAAAVREAAQQMAELLLVERMAEWREAELRRQQAEQEEELHAALEKLQQQEERRRVAIRRQERELEAKQAEVEAQEAAAAAAERAAAATQQAAQEARAAAADEVARQKAKAEQLRQEAKAFSDTKRAEIERERRALEEQEAKTREEAKKLQRLQSETRAMPAYWEKSTAAKAKDGFAVLPLDSRRDAAVWKALERLLLTDPAKLKQSGADRSGTRHDRLQLACAWRLEHPPMWERYMGGQQQVLRDRRLLQKTHVRASGGLPLATARAASGLPGPLRADVNEAVLMHGTSPGVLLSVLSTGPNERFSGTNAGTAYGDGTYLAEDAGKSDQYVGVDERYDGGSELHKRLYAHGAHHPGKVYYLLVCRVALGHHVRTRAAGPGATSLDDGRPVFPISFRELAAVPSVTPPVHYHALLADVLGAGARYREVVVFHSELIYPEYVLAYQRFEGGRGPL